MARAMSELRKTVTARPGQRFHFHHRAGACVGLDRDGVVLPSAEAALSHAYLMVLGRSQLAASSPALHVLEVTDAAGTRLFDLPFASVVTRTAPADERRRYRN